jgi:hypothetical protein
MGILITCSIFYTVIFFISMLLFSKKFIPKKSDISILLYAGLYDALNGLFVIYASQPNRVPSIIQPFLTNWSIIASVIGNKFIVRDTKIYNNKFVWSAALCIIGSIVIISVPQLLQGESESAFDFIIWSLVYIIGASFGAIFNVYQTKFYNNQYEPQFDELKLNNLETNESTPLIRKNKIIMRDFLDQSSLLLFYQSAIQLIVMFLLIWVDIMPFFGSSTQTNFAENIKLMFTCNFTSECGNTYIYYILFNIGYVLSYIGSCYINIKSAPFNMIVTVLTSPIVVIFWLIFPNINPSPNNIGIEYAIPSLFVATIGVVIWKYWDK